MERLAVFGGTFNPIHNGHLHIAREFANRLRADRVLIIPSMVPPHKQAADLAPAGARLEMCRLAVQGNPLFEISGMELERGGPSYTVDTLRELKNTRPNSELFLLMGEDMFLTLENWREPHVIYSLCTLCAAPRSDRGLTDMLDYAARMEQFGAKYRLENIDFLPISSTLVRMAARGGNPLAGLVPQSVERYIRQKGLYGAKPE